MIRFCLGDTVIVVTFADRIIKDLNDIFEETPDQVNMSA